MSTSSKKKDNVTLHSPIETEETEEMISAPAPTSKHPKGKIIRGGLRSINAHAEQKELELRRSRSSTTVVTATGEVQTNVKAQVYVHDLDLFVTVQILDDTPAVLSPGTLRDEHGYTYERVSGKQPRWTKQGKNILCKTENFVPLVVPG